MSEDQIILSAFVVVRDAGLYNMITEGVGVTSSVAAILGVWRQTKALGTFIRTSRKYFDKYFESSSDDLKQYRQNAMNMPFGTDYMFNKAREIVGSSEKDPVEFYNELETRGWTWEVWLVTNAREYYLTKAFELRQQGYISRISSETNLDVLIIYASQIPERSEAISSGSAVDHKDRMVVW